MSRHVILPPGQSAPAASGPTAKIAQRPGPTAAEPTELTGKLVDDGTPITEAGTKRIPVPKGTKVTIGGREYVAQSDEGITIRGFQHAQNGQPTSVVIIDAPTKEAAAFANHLVATGQMLSEEEVLWRRKRGLPIDPSQIYDRKTGKLVAVDMKRRRDMKTDDELLEDWLAHLAATDPRLAHTTEGIEEKKTKLLAERPETSEAPRAAVAQETEAAEAAEEMIELTTRGKIK